MTSQAAPRDAAEPCPCPSPVPMMPAAAPHAVAVPIRKTPLLKPVSRCCHRNPWWGSYQPHPAAPAAQSSAAGSSSEHSTGGNTPSLRPLSRCSSSMQPNARLPPLCLPKGNHRPQLRPVVLFTLPLDAQLLPFECFKMNTA